MDAGTQETDQSIYMCYLDEKYADQGQCRDLQVTSLTGVYIMANKVTAFRRRLYSLLRDIFLFDVKGTLIPLPIPCHASELFKDAKKSDGTIVTDKDRINFQRRLIGIVNDMNLQIVRFGYRRNDDLEKLKTNSDENYNTFEKHLLGLIFSAFMPDAIFDDDTIESSDDHSASKYTVYYCMENDNSPLQQWHFQQNTAINMWHQEFLGKSATVDFDQVGDVLSYTKGDAPGVLPDCIGYMLHHRWLKHQGHKLTPFKLELVKVCNEIRPELLHESIVDVEMMN